jgi:hypothetical protein
VPLGNRLVSATARSAWRPRAPPSASRRCTARAVRMAHRQSSASGRARQIGPGSRLEALPGRLRIVENAAQQKGGPKATLSLRKKPRASMAQPRDRVHALWEETGVTCFLQVRPTKRRDGSHIAIKKAARKPPACLPCQGGLLLRPRLQHDCRFVRLDLLARIDLRKDAVLAFRGGYLGFVRSETFVDFLLCAGDSPPRWRTERSLLVRSAPKMAACISRSIRASWPSSRRCAA